VKAVRVSNLSPYRRSNMTSSARSLVGAAKYMRYTMGSLSAVLFAACSGGS
jgi:hypothetical protein